MGVLGDTLLWLLVSLVLSGGATALGLYIGYRWVTGRALLRRPLMRESLILWGAQAGLALLARFALAPLIGDTASGLVWWPACFVLCMWLVWKRLRLTRQNAAAVTLAVFLTILGVTALVRFVLLIVGFAWALVSSG